MIDNDHEPLFSIIIPSFNGSATICSAIESVIVQDYVDFEIIVVDDGSTDDTERVIKSNFRTHLVRYFWQKNSGPFIARLKGIREAKGRYIGFLDSDDRLAKNYFETLLFYFSQFPRADYIHFAFDVFCKGTLSKFGSDQKPTLICGQHNLLVTLFSGPGKYELCRYCFIKDAVMRGIDQTVTSSPRSEDLLMVYCILRHCQSGLYINESLYLYMLVPHADTANELYGIAKIYETILRDLVIRFSSDGDSVSRFVIQSLKDIVLALFDRLFFERMSYRKMRDVYFNIRNLEFFQSLFKTANSYAEKTKLRQIRHPLLVVHIMVKARYLAKRFVRKVSRS